MIEDYKTYYVVKEIINNYIVYMKQINGDQYIDTGKLNMTEEEIREALQEEGIDAIKNILDKQYIEDLSVDSQKIKLWQEKYKQKGSYQENVVYNLNIEDIAKTYLNENITLVFVNAKINNQELELLIKLDLINNTHSIFLEDYIEKYNYNKEKKKEDINISSNHIEANSYNSHIKVEATETYVMSQYFSEYRMKMIYDTKNAYELLDEEYKKEKYGSYQNFENYINNKKQQILYTSIDKYQVTEHDGIKKYVCTDTNGKYYIFVENSVTDYKVILDTYTVDLPEFLDKYNKNEEKIKCGMNIQKIFDAINDGDYNYAYKKLDETFKMNNFPNVQSFEQYCLTYFSNNQLVYEDCENSGEIYMYNIIVTKDNENTVKKTIIMKLLEETNFVFSFNVE